jgi:hypothetical protein
MIGPEHEGPRPAAGPGFSDAVTFAFGDAEGELFGLARIGLRPGSAPTASALALVFADGEVAVALAEGEAEVADPAWTAIEVAGVRMEVLEPLREWRVAAAATGGGFDLRFTAACPPIELGPDDPAARLGGMEGYEQLCRVEGSASAGGATRTVACLGQRGHAWGVPRWEELELARTVSAWWDEAHALTLSAVRPAGATGHDQEAISAFLVDDGPAPAIVSVTEPRLSTTYDAAGRQQRAGLELWVGEDDELPRRAAGRVACGTSLELGELRLDCSFFHWLMEGRAGVGRYDVLRKA